MLLLQPYGRASAVGTSMQIVNPATGCYMIINNYIYSQISPYLNRLLENSLCIYRSAFLFCRFLDIYHDIVCHFCAARALLTENPTSRTTLIRILFTFHCYRSTSAEFRPPRDPKISYQIYPLMSAAGRTGILHKPWK